MKYRLPFRDLVLGVTHPDEIVPHYSTEKQRFSEKALRLAHVKAAIALNSVDGLPPDDETRAIMNEHVEGRMTVDQCVESYLSIKRAQKH